MTLIALLVIAVCLVYLASGTMEPHSSREGETIGLIAAIDAALSAYETDHKGALPPSSENYLLVKELTSGGPTNKAYILPRRNELNANREFVDGWGTPLRFVFKGKDDARIISAGPDKIFGTPDDITNQ